MHHVGLDSAQACGCERREEAAARGREAACRPGEAGRSLCLFPSHQHCQQPSDVDSAWLVSALAAGPLLGGTPGPAGARRPASLRPPPAFPPGLPFLAGCGQVWASARQEGPGDIGRGLCYLGPSLWLLRSGSLGPGTVDAQPSISLGTRAFLDPAVVILFHTGTRPVLFFRL